MNRPWVHVLAGAAAMAACTLSAPAASAAEQTQRATAEILYLLQATEASGCEFYRNGSWHSAAEARAHLARKHEEVQKRQALRNADDFIEAVATRSSITGEPYSMRCQDAQPVPSAAWFRNALQRYRAGASSVR